MKYLYSILDDRGPFIICSKGTPLYAGTTGGESHSSLEQELYRRFSKNYSVLYPMDYWCSGIVPMVLEGSEVEWEGDIEYEYDIVVNNPLFLKEDTHVEQKVAPKGRKFQIHPTGKEFRAFFSIKRRYKDYSHLGVKTNIPFHQGILLLASFLGSPVVGDHLYGLHVPLLLSTLKRKKYKVKSYQEELPLIQRPAIHLCRVKKSEDIWEAPLPKDFHAVLYNLGKYNTLAEEQFLEDWLEKLRS